MFRPDLAIAKAEDKVAAAQEVVPHLRGNALGMEDQFKRGRGRGAIPVFMSENDRKALRAAFDAFDGDGDGMLTEEEVMAALTRKTGKGTELSEEAARATWQRWVVEFDRDEDGRIGIWELSSDGRAGVE